MHVEMTIFCSILLSVYFFVPKPKWKLTSCTRWQTSLAKMQEKNLGQRHKVQFFFASLGTSQVGGQFLCPYELLYDLPIRSTTPGYMGICHPNYPNFYWLLGPGTGLGTNSIIFMIECQVRQNNILILFRLLTCFCVWLLSCFAKLIQSEYLTKVYEIYVSRPTICTAREAESTVIEEVFKGSKVPPKLFK